MLALALAMLTAPAASAHDLYKGSNWAAMAGDRKAAAIGDQLTILVFQTAEASNSAQNSSRKSTDIGGRFSAGDIDEDASLDFGGGYTGRGEVRRSERLVSQFSVVVQSVLPNGDLIIAGEQHMRINGENSRIGVRGRVRQEDISAENRVLSSLIADAEISYNGQGFVSRSAKPGLVTRIFRFLGLS